VLLFLGYLQCTTEVAKKHKSSCREKRSACRYLV